MVNKCPECGSVSEDDAIFCAMCGKMFSEAPLSASVSGILETTSAPPAGPENAVRTKMVGSIVISVLMLAAVSGISVIAVGGTVSFEVDYDERDFIFRNTSEGIFENYAWRIEGEDGTVLEKNTGNAGSLRWSSDDMYGEYTEGMYHITLYAYTYFGTEMSHSEDVLEDGERGYTVTWTHAGKEHAVDVSMYLSEYYRYKEHSFTSVNQQTDPRWPGSNVDHSLVTEFMQTDSEHDAFSAIMSQLKTSAPEGEEAQVNYLMGFVQNLDDGNTYKTDTDARGHPTEYWSFPMETLFNKGGDCEDLAMLFMAICINFFDEMDTALVLFWGDDDVEGHAMAALAMSAPPSGMDQNMDLDYVVEGTPYYVCETTSNNPWWKPGRISSPYSELRPNSIIAV